MGANTKTSENEEEAIKLQEMPGRPLKVLIIEDENQVARLIELELSYEGYQVEIAKTGKEGLERPLGGAEREAQQVFGGYIPWANAQ